MTALPEINYQAVCQRLSGKISELIYQNTQLEILAELLRDERDSALMAAQNSQTHNTDTETQNPR
jgi:hypothetical protein